MKKLQLAQMENLEGGGFWGWVGAGLVCAAGAVVTVQTLGIAGEGAAVVCGAAIMAASN